MPGHQHPRLREHHRIFDRGFVGENVAVASDALDDVLFIAVNLRILEPGEPPPSQVSSFRPTTSTTSVSPSQWPMEWPSIGCIQILRMRAAVHIYERGRWNPGNFRREWR